MNSFFAWIGGKNYLKKTIAALMPDSFNRYIEVFGGAAWVLFYRDKYAEMEVYNDYNGDLVNLFRCVKYHCPELQRELSFLLNSRELFNDFRQQHTKGMTDIQRAARFYFLLKVSYGSNGRSYGCIKKDISAMTQYLSRIEERLSAVIIERKDFEDLLSVYDRPDAFFYVDPPYYQAEKYYQVEFNKEDHVRLAKKLHTIQGKFLLSYNNCDFVRELYKDYDMEGITRQHNLMARYKGENNDYRELLILNY